MLKTLASFVMGLSLVVLVPVLPLAQGRGGGGGEGQEKVTICHKAGEHNQHTITVAKPAVPAHQKHGDTIGPCPGTPKK
jgi:hypothetical protein